MKIETDLPSAAKLLHDGARAFARIEHNGIMVSETALDEALSNTTRLIGELERELHEDKVYKRWKKVFGFKTNLGSTQQAAHLMFNVFKFPVTKVTEKGSPSMDEEALESIHLPFCEKYVKWKKLQKVRSTYLVGLKKEIVQDRDGYWYLHPMYNLHVAETYRSSCSLTNFQNQPVRNPDMADVIRKLYVARKGRQLVEIDFSGIEVRVAYCYHLDPTMRTYLLDKTTDMHRDMAAEIYLLKQHEVGKPIRHAGKNMFVFPEFYGSVYFQCAAHLWAEMHRRNFALPDGTLVADHLAKKGIKELGNCNPNHIQDNGTEPGTFVHHLQQVEKRFWGKRFKDYAQWKKDWYDEYLENGEFAMFTGFRCKGVYRRNQVINYPVQGAAFHCNLQSIVWIQQEINRRKMKSLLVGQIHDSLLIDAVEEEVQELIPLCRGIMTKELPAAWDWLTIPLEVEVEVTPTDGSWADKKIWTEQEGVWAIRPSKHENHH